MGTMQWLAHFERATERKRDIDWTRGLELPEHLRPHVVRSLAIFQRGLTSPGLNLRSKVRQSCTPEFARCVDLYVGEKRVHSELLMRLVWEAGGSPRNRQMADFALRRVRRRADWIWEMLVILTAEMAASPFLRVLANTIEDPLTRQVLESMLEDQAYHLGFHIDALRPEMEQRDNVERLAMQQAWGSVFTATLGVLLTSHRDTFRALDYQKLTFWTDAWNLFAQVQTGLNGSQHLSAILGKDPRLKFAL